MTEAHNFPRIGGESTVFDAVTVSYRNGAYVATARRDGITATRRVSDRRGMATASEDATAAAWVARCAMAEKWRDEGYRKAGGEHHDDESSRFIRRTSDETHAEWTDPSRYAVVVSSEVPGHAYVVTFIPRDLIAR